MPAKSRRNTFAFLTIGVILIAIILLAPRIFGGSRGMDYKSKLGDIDDALDSTLSERSSYPIVGSDVNSIKDLINVVDSYFEGEWKPGIKGTKYMYCTNSAGTLFVMCIGPEDGRRDFLCEGPGLGELIHQTQDNAYGKLPDCSNSITETWDGEGNWN